MAITLYSSATLANMLSILRSGECSIMVTLNEVSESNLKEFADALHIFRLEPIREILKPNSDNKATLAELIYIEEAHRLAQSGEVDQINNMTDLQLRLVAYGKNILSLEKVYSRSSFQIRISLLAMFACRPTLQFENCELDPKSSEEDDGEEDDESDEKIILTKCNGVVMRY
ncbi:hypothetical protein N0V95_007897 [Ascochyta clinopodiicola]|nr:hypothetical protein N0V95_007897 [Ascochyta clinopodiicola]